MSHPAWQTAASQRIVAQCARIIRLRRMVYILAATVAMSGALLIWVALGWHC